jgi:S1-C subfamily serine protease
MTVVDLPDRPGRNLPERPISKAPGSQHSGGMSDLANLSAELAAAVESAAQFVVSIDARPRATSSGIIWKPGVIVTVEHAIRRTDEIRITLPDGRSTAAALAGRDSSTDIAVLKYDDSGATPEPRVAANGRPGNIALAVGRTQHGPTATMGIISAVDQSWRTWRGGLIDRFIRLDLELYASLSGAPVVSSSGGFVGMATAGLSRTAAIAIPPETLDRVASELLAKGKVSRGYLGIGLQPVPLPTYLSEKLKLGRAGVIVLSVEPGGPAQAGGIVIGDVLLSIAERPVTDLGDVQSALGSDSVGRTVPVELLRGGERKTVEVRIGERPSPRED